MVARVWSGVLASLAMWWKSMAGDGGGGAGAGAVGRLWSCRLPSPERRYAGSTRMCSASIRSPRSSSLPQTPPESIKGSAWAAKNLIVNLGAPKSCSY
ncbi:hypothetical protein B0T26DRAFT_715306 [Lasiosphaeria miniovina]|uniref:Secreted protein n=1 Tax=Lasiosphaeria miniovina TaxID=1954250 RepID=A0AA40ABI1_9PEZI|nr:uncharacterized protein B0T26DRAFT_715306 [Lasiosphaeria miniovina]KAK0712801.1 hypothetical protein B0T26DRAFT_715306 [Lasiosphaeria miniovina]